MDQLNPGYKFVTLLLLSLALSFTYRTTLNLVVFGLCILVTALTPSSNKRRLLLGLLPFLLTATGLFLSGLFFPAQGEAITGSWGEATMAVSSLGGAMQLASRVLAFGGIGMLFALTTNSAEFIMSLMQQFRLPPKFAYGLLAAYHFLPVVHSEYTIVKSAMRVRGVKASPLSGKMLLPMLVHALERSESIAMAMESRGFDSDAPRGVAFPVPLRIIDFLFFIAVVLLTAAGFLWL